MSALAVADRFLQANWQAQDQEQALLLLQTRPSIAFRSRNWKRSFRPRRQPCRHSTSIMGKGWPGVDIPSPWRCMKFHPGKDCVKVFTTIVVTRTGKNDWAVDKLP